MRLTFVLGRWQLILFLVELCGVERGLYQQNPNNRTLKIPL